MFLHIGLDKVILTDDIVGIFDLDNTTVSKHTRDYLSKSEKSKTVVNVCTDLPKSFIVCKNPARDKKTVYITQLGTATLLKRLGSASSGLK
ncbi:MAG: DUF370 domain-containing protein [Clostridia bacterium]|jgi:hypothetical protein|nr:DUF370 domain-containing protein [Clostridia bacterium]MBQ4245233.1 DUF370 domain-containing protein [Clostridia bacterium]